MKKSNGSKTVEPQYFQRFGLQFRIQHIALFLGTLGLIFTGIPLWCLGRPEYGWSQSVVSFFGPVATIRCLHRAFGVSLILVSVYHLLYTVYTREGRRELIELLPGPKDIADVMKNSMYFLGLSKERARFRRYSYLEKFDYWAVYWGCVIMIGTGLAQWFPEATAYCAPWLTYALAAEIHADEAILATLALFVWHFYNVHFNPSRFPGTLLWLHGRMSREEMLHEHPLEYEKLMSAKK